MAQTEHKKELAGSPQRRRDGRMARADRQPPLGARARSETVSSTTEGAAQRAGAREPRGAARRPLTAPADSHDALVGAPGDRIPSSGLRAKGKDAVTEGDQKRWKDDLDRRGQGEGSGHWPRVVPALAGWRRWHGCADRSATRDADPGDAFGNSVGKAGKDLADAGQSVGRLARPRRVCSRDAGRRVRRSTVERSTAPRLRSCCRL